MGTLIENGKKNLCIIAALKQFNNITFGLWELVIDIFYYSLTFYKQNNSLINRESILLLLKQITGW